MVLLRKDSFGNINIGGHPIIMDERESICSIYQNSVINSESKMRN